MVSTNACIGMLLAFRGDAGMSGYRGNRKTDQLCNIIVASSQ